MSKNEFDALLLKKLQEEAFEYDPKSWEQLSERLNTSMPVLNKTQPFDALLHEKLAEDTFEYKPQSWQQLSEKLHEPIPENEDKDRKVIPFPNKNWKIALGTAAAICILVALAIGLNRTDKNTLGNAPSWVNKSNTALPKTNKNAVNPTQETTSQQATQNVATASNNASKTVNNPVSNRKITSSQHTPFNAPSNNNPVLQNSTPEQKIPAEQQVAAEPKDNSREVNLFNKKMMEPAPKPQLSTAEIAQRNAADNWPENYMKSNAGNQKPKTHVAVGGGVNYGNLNTGYTAGVTVKRKVGSDFFVDGTVAMLYNNNANNVAVNNGPPITNVASRPSSTMSSISSPALDPIQRLYYVQVNPSLGYQVEDRVAVSVGGDFQKMLGGNDEVVQPQNDNTKIFPTLDVGLTTKTEFTISPNLQAGVVYREGLNNLVNGSDAGKYVNRRYLQVQFKYNIPMGGK